MIFLLYIIPQDWKVAVLPWKQIFINLLIYLSFCFSINPSFSLSSIHPSIYLSIHSSILSSSYPSFHSPILSSIHSSILSPILLSIYPSIHLPINPSIHLFIHPLLLVLQCSRNWPIESILIFIIWATNRFSRIPTKQ